VTASKEFTWIPDVYHHTLRNSSHAPCSVTIMTSTPSGSTLPVLALPHPVVLLPTGRITFPVSKAVGEALLAKVRESDEQPLVAAVPQTAPEASLYQWGTASRILRLIKPTTNNMKQYYLLTLNGITRVRILDSNPDRPVLNTGIVYRKVEYPTASGAPSPETAVKFKAAALKLLDQLSKDTTQQTKKDSYNRAMATVEEASSTRAPWVADVIVSSINGEYADKLGKLPRQFLLPPAFLH
jgi:ATP-dependent Lon protease